MKKIKKMWQENSILFVLLTILIVCVIAILIVVVTYFVGNSKSKYGDRLDGIDKYPFVEETQNEIVSKMKEDEKILDVTFRKSGKTIYVTILFDPSVTLVQAQSKSLESLDYYSEETLGYYDIQFLVQAEATDKSDGYKIMGSHNVSGTGGIVWNNNTKFETDKE